MYQLIRKKRLLLLRKEAKSLQLKIEEETGVPMKFKLKPGDSVYRAFDDIDSPKRDIKIRRRSFKKHDGEKLLSVSGMKQKTFDSENDGLKLVAEYLRNQIHFEEHSTSCASRKNILLRTKSQILIKSNPPYQISPVLSEYKDYLRALSQNISSPNFKKLFKRMKGNGKNPIIVVTKHE